MVGHVAPEAMNGGPIALVKDNDQIDIDAAKGKLDLLITVVPEMPFWIK